MARVIWVLLCALAFGGTAFAATPGPGGHKATGPPESNSIIDSRPDTENNTVALCYRCAIAYDQTSTKGQVIEFGVQPNHDGHHTALGGAAHNLA